MKMTADKTGQINDYAYSGTGDRVSNLSHSHVSMFTLSEVAEMFCMPLLALQLLISDGLIASRKSTRNPWYISQQELNGYLRSMEQLDV